MTDSEQLILEMLKDGERRWKDFERILVESGKMSKSTLSEALLRLERDGKIKRFVDSSKKPAVILYSLSCFETQVEQRVREVVEELRREFRFFREPTVKEVAFKVGEPPEVVRSVLYRLAPKIGWREQSKKEAEMEAEVAINLAGWLICLRKGVQDSELSKLANEAIASAPPEVVKMAEKIAENYPELAPEAKPCIKGPMQYFSAGLDPWPDGTERVWKKVFLTDPPASGTRSFFMAVPNSL